ncbi:orotidine-5'-phosphate decarboxylase [Legionella geestiana]|uniref:orotidine-5'-phosphate decarboxylase n=1 Tax=Legionella geestiana TaxID=45065 RepID=UPI001091E193|nr:orotidine-5'-phosphate decarboxylase [Legionella geestiana]QDQ39027.1 orotidine-5'-phosphate decarboxylase [Legionella geestiana]
MVPRLIVALDFDSAEKALAFTDCVDPTLCALKVGSELFTAAGPKLVEALVLRQFRVFLDLKWHDIPNTVASACRVAASLGVWMVNVHASGGLPMLMAAREALSGRDAPLLIAVTVLTSFDEAQLKATGCATNLTQQVLTLASLARDAGLDGVVSSALEAQSIKSACGSSFITVTPGIRLPEDEASDQRRIMTPEAAIAAGSDYLVMGRSITRSENPTLVLEKLRDITNTP